MLTNPVATTAGEDNELAKIDKAVHDPGGLLLKGPSAVDGVVSDDIRDPLMIGDRRRENEQRNKSILASYSQPKSSRTQQKSVLGR